MHHVSSRSPSDELDHSPDNSPRSNYSAHYSSPDNSPRSKYPPHYSSQHSLFHNREIYVPSPRNSASAERSRQDQPEHLVYGRKTVHDGNWVLSQRRSQERRYIPRKDIVIHDPVRYAYPVHGRSLSEGRYYELRGRDGLRDSGQLRVSRYIRNRSQSPHRNAIAVKQIQHTDNVIRAIQAGLEKRQRAIRLSLYQMPDPADYEWEI